MVETPTPPLFYWIRENWEWLTAAIAGISVLIWAWIKHAIIDKIKVIGGTQRKIVRIIPVEALEKGYLLSTQEACAKNRASCQNHIITDELLDTMIIMKQAMALVIAHSENIPQDKKDKIMEELVK